MGSSVPPSPSSIVNEMRADAPVGSAKTGLYGGPSRKPSSGSSAMRSSSCSSTTAGQAVSVSVHTYPELRAMLDDASFDRPVRVLETHNGLTGLIAEQYLWSV